MKTIRYEQNQLEEVCDAIMDEHTMAFPTDTVYGLGVRFDSEKALMKLKNAKLRPESKPIPMMVSKLAQIEDVAYVSDKAKRLIEHFMPGAFTIILKKKEHVPAYVTNAMDTIAIRMPDDAFVLSIMNAINIPLLVSSANISANHSCQSKEEVLEQLDGRIDGIVLGKSKLGEASTIVDATSDVCKVVRQGPISEEEIQKIWEERK